MQTAVLKPIANTVRLVTGSHPRPGDIVLAVLIVGECIESKRWLDILRQHSTTMMNHYMLAEDLEVVLPYSHLRPSQTPCFVVFVDGWPVDWFPAPAPDAGRPADLVRVVQSFLQKTYAPDVRIALRTEPVLGDGAP